MLLFGLMTPPKTCNLRSRYLELPPSLAKIRHEQLCTQASRPVASSLRARGYATLEQLLPPSKLQHLFSEVGAGVDETLAAVSLACEMRPKTGNGGDDGLCHDLFSPLSPFARRGLAGSRRSPNSKEGPRRSDSRGTSRGTIRGTSRGSGRPWTGGGGGASETRRKKGPPRISVNGLGFEGGVGGTGKWNGRWDPSRYTSRPEEWIRPPPSVIKRRWDSNAKVSCEHTRLARPKCFTRYLLGTVGRKSYFLLSHVVTWYQHFMPVPS